MRRKRGAVLAGALAAFVCLGGLFGWSAFAVALRAQYGFSALQTQVIFSLTVATFTVCTTVAGRLMGRWGPRPLTLIGGLLFGAGYGLASVSEGRFAVLAVSIGLLSGAGIGFGYICPLTACIQWFPDRKGLATGVTVASFGGGAILLTTLVEALLSRGWTVLEVFRLIGFAYGSVVCLGALLMFRPPVAPSPQIQFQKLVGTLIRDRAFRTLVAGLFSGTFAGLLLIGSLKPIGLSAGLPSSLAALAISFFAVGNAGGRIAWGWLSDRLGYRTIPWSLLWLGLAVLALIVARHTGPAFLVVSLLAGAGFGACFVLYAAQVARRYGSDQVGRVYPLVFLAYGVAALVGPTLGGFLFDLTGSYVPPLLVSAAIVLAGAWRVRREPEGAAKQSFTEGNEGNEGAEQWPIKPSQAEKITER